MKNHSMIRAAGAAIALIFAAGVASAQPKLEIVGGDTYDWGKVAPGKLTTVVEVKNTGNADLKISEVRPGCGCTVAPIDKNLLKPSEIAKISVTLDVTSRTGPTEKVVTITSNDSALPSRILHLKADVHRAITVSPAQYILVNNATKGAEIPASPMTIKNTSDAPITIQLPKLAETGNVSIRFDMKAPRQLKPGEEFALTAYVTPKEARTVYGTVKLATSSSEMPSLDIPITGTMAQPAATSQPTPQLSSTKPEPHK